MTLACVLALRLPSASAADLGPAGGQGGMQQSSQCTQERVVIGIKIRVGALVDRVEALCAVFTDGVRGQVTGGQSTNGGFIGGTGGQPFELRCGRNRAVVGMKGRAGSYLDALAVACARLRSDGTIRHATRSWTTRKGGSGGSAFGPLTCPDRPVTALVGKGDAWVDSLGMACG